MDVPEERARSGHTGDGVRFMLIGSLGLSLVALVIALLAFAR